MLLCLIYILLSLCFQNTFVAIVATFSNNFSVPNLQVPFHFVATNLAPINIDWTSLLLFQSNCSQPADKCPHLQLHHTTYPFFSLLHCARGNARGSCLFFLWLHLHTMKGLKPIWRFLSSSRSRFRHIAIKWGTTNSSRTKILKSH